MLLELIPFVILNNAMAFVYAYFFFDFLCFEMSLLLLTVTLWGYLISIAYCIYTPRKLCLWEGILFSRCPTDRPCVRNVLFS